VWENETKADTSRLKAMHSIAWDGYLFSQPDSAFYYAQLAYDFAEVRGLKAYMASALNTQGVSFYVKGDYSNALNYYQRSIALSEQIPDHIRIGRSLTNIGLVYTFQGDNLRALDYYQRSLKIHEELSDKRGIAKNFGNIGIIYRKQGNYQRALDYYERSLKIKEEISDKQGSSITLNNIGNIYRTQGYYDKALDYYQRSLKVKEEIGHSKGIANSLSNIGVVYQMQGDFTKALNYYHQSLKIKEEMKDKQGITISLEKIGSLYLEQRNYSKAKEWCERSLKVSEETGSIEMQRVICECLYAAFKGLNNGNRALVFHERMLVLDDSIKSKETEKKLAQMEFSKKVLADSLKQEEEKLKVQIAHDKDLQKKSRSRNLFLVLGLLLLVAAIGFYSRWRYVKKSKIIIEKEKDRSENLLLNILPAEIAQELKEKGEANARDIDQVSIIFTDFKEFTQMSAKLTAKELVAEINSCFKAFDNICGKYNIEKIKTIGDAYMAATGLPNPSQQSTTNAVLGALEMAEFMVKRKKDKESSGQSPFNMRTGIHTGPVVAGIVGVKKFQYDIWGDTVNIAARMESNGEVDKVNISQSTYELIKDDPQFVFEKRGKINAKGKGEMDMYFVEIA
ncbi:MAG: tetratricopeptide repeat protein, partial [Bacteroidia bacterium]|nr:tetratricopeptide repeat protein [Bacteroidia bacterium]